MAIVFVFGSNLAGRHGAGAAKYAREHYGAIYGQGIGRQGNSYGIPTKDEKLNTLGLDVIVNHVGTFIEYAKSQSGDLFLLTPIGTGLAGYTREEIYSLLHIFDVPSNVVLTKEWLSL